MIAFGVNDSLHCQSSFGMVYILGNHMSKTGKWMQESKSNGKSLAIIGLVLLVALIVFWLITDTFFMVGMFIALGVSIGGLVLMMRERQTAG